MALKIMHLICIGIGEFVGEIRTVNYTIRIEAGDAPKTFRMTIKSPTNDGFSSPLRDVTLKYGEHLEGVKEALRVSTFFYNEEADYIACINRFLEENFFKAPTGKKFYAEVHM